MGGLTIKNTFLTIEEDVSDEEEGLARQRRGFVTCPDILSFNEAVHEEAPRQAAESLPAATETSEEHPVLLGAEQWRPSVEMPTDYKVVVRNTFIEQEPEEPESPRPTRRVTCPGVLASDLTTLLSSPSTQAAGSDSEDEDLDDDENPDLKEQAHRDGYMRRRSSIRTQDMTGPMDSIKVVDGRRVSFIPPPVVEADEEVESPKVHRNCDTEALIERFEWEEAQMETTPQKNRGEDLHAWDGETPQAHCQAEITSPGITNTPSTPHEAPEDEEESSSPRVSRGGLPRDTQDMRDILLEDEGPAGECPAPQATPQYLRAAVPVSLYSCMDGTAPAPAPQAQAGARLPCATGQPLSLSRAVEGSGSPLNLPMVTPVSLATAVDEGNLGGSPHRVPAADPAMGHNLMMAAGQPWPMPMMYGGFGTCSPFTWAPPPICVGPSQAAEQPKRVPEYSGTSRPRSTRPIGAPPSPRRPERTEKAAPPPAPEPREPPTVTNEAPLQAGLVAPGAAAATTRNGRRLRLWVHIYLHMQVPGFDLVPRLIGRGGANMKRIAEATGAKVRIRGKGSGHYEMDGKQEAPTPLMVAVTTDKQDENGFRHAIELVVKELKNTEARYRTFCQKQGIPHEGPCYSVGIWSEEAKQCLGDVCKDIPMSSGGKRGED